MNPHLVVAIRSDEDDRQSAPFGLKLRLQFKTGHARQVNVRDQAHCVVSGLWIQELLRGAEAECADPFRFDQTLQWPPNRFVVVDDCYESWVLPDTHR
jgi:hypothetical protein